MQKLLAKFFVTLFFFLSVSSVIAQNKPKMIVQKFEVKSDVQISLTTFDLLMDEIVSSLKRTKKFGEVARFSPPFTTEPDADLTPPTDYLIKGVITKHTSAGVFRKIMSYGMIDETTVYLTFTVTDRRSGKEIIKKDVKGKIAQSFLLSQAFQPANKIADILKKYFKKGYV